MFLKEDCIKCLLNFVVLLHKKKLKKKIFKCFFKVKEITVMLSDKTGPPQGSLIF